MYLVGEKTLFSVSTAVSGDRSEDIAAPLTSAWRSQIPFGRKAQGSGVRHSSSRLPNGAADPKPALIPGARCAPCASQGHSGCLGALPHATAHTAPGSPLPASQHGLASPASPLKLGFKAGTGLHKVLAGLQTRPVSHFFCCSMTRKPK